MSFALTPLLCDACGVETEAPADPPEGIEAEGEGPFLPVGWVDLRVERVVVDPEHAAQTAELQKAVKAARKSARETAATSQPPIPVEAIEPQMVAAAEIQHQVTAEPHQQLAWVRHFCPNCCTERLRAVGITLE